VNTIVKATALLIIGVAGGIWSAHRGIERAGAAYPGSPWKTWTRDAVQHSPYADAHFMLAGQLPMPASQFIVYEAGQDSNGNDLDGGCAYVVAAKLPAVRWWSISAGAAGPSEEPDAKRGPARHISSAKAIAEASGEVRISVAPSPAPGNWISAGDGSPFTLMLVLHDPTRRGGPFPSPDELPTIQKTACG
jgi:hypothetical protein